MGSLCSAFLYGFSTAEAVSHNRMLLAQDVEYNAQRNAVFWETRPVLVLRRTAEISEPFCISFQSLILLCCYLLLLLSLLAWHLSDAFLQLLPLPDGIYGFA